MAQSGTGDIKRRLNKRQVLQLPTAANNSQEKTHKNLFR